MEKLNSKDEVRIGKKKRKLTIFFLSCLFILLVQLFHIQFIDHGTYVGIAAGNLRKFDPMIAPRGLIKDSRGIVLAENVLQYDIVVNWGSDKKMRGSIRSLLRFIPLDTTAVFARLNSWQKRDPGVDFPVIPAADKVAISIVRENDDLLKNLDVEMKAKRKYPFGKMASHVLGSVGEVNAEDISNSGEKSYKLGDVIGKMGLELECEKYMRGVDGRKPDAKRLPESILDEVRKYYRPPVPGKDVYLTIDVRLQSVLEALLSPWKSGAAVAMNVKDGSILAAASIPEYDPNIFSFGISIDEWEELHKREDRPLFNRIIQATYPPGSTLKIISAYAALDNKIVRKDEVITYCTGAHRFGNRIFRCWKSGGHGFMNLYSAIVQSCDSYFFKVAESIDVDELAVAARKFGLGEPTGVDLPGETRGLVPDRNYYNRRFGKGKWTQGNVLNNIIGQGEYLVTVLQMARLTAAIANDGYLVTPHFLGRVEGIKGFGYPSKRVPFVSDELLGFLRKSMADVVQTPSGTAYWSRDEDIPFAGKTGTAQNPHGGDHAWFISYAPIENPEIAVSIIIENAGHGGSIAAPLARDLYREYFSRKADRDVSSGIMRRFASRGGYN